MPSPAYGLLQTDSLCVQMVRRHQNDDEQVDTGIGRFGMIFKFELRRRKVSIVDGLLFAHLSLNLKNQQQASCKLRESPPDE